LSADYIWHDGTFGSAYLLNKGAVQKMPGTSIAAIASTDIEPGWLIYCESTGGGYTANNLYQRNEDNTAFDIVGLKGHTHIDSNSGGALYEVGIDNIPVSLKYDKRNARATSFWSTIVTSGTITDDATNGCVQVQSGATSGGSATISDGGARKLNFSKPSAFETTLEVTSATNFQVKLGVRAEDINGGNLTPAKYGIEACSSSGTNWLVFSSDGTTRSTLATSTPVATGAADVYRVECDPGTEVRFYKNGTLQATKTTNIPSTGTTGNNDLYRAGVKNSAAENKILRHYGVIIEGGI
jgi:hypothetical protein